MDHSQFWLFQIILNTCIWVFIWYTFSFLCGEIPELGLLNCLISVCLTFQETAKLFSRLTSISHSYEQGRRVSHLPYSYQYLVLSVFLVIFVGVNGHFIVFLVYISLKINDVEDFTCVFCHMFSLVIYLFKIFRNGLSCYWDIRYKPVIRYVLGKIFSWFVSCPFISLTVSFK